MKFVDIVNIIVAIIFFVLLVLLVIQVALKITVHSPITDILLSSTLGLVVSYIIFATNKFYHFMGQSKEFMSNTKDSFKIAREDINRINNKLDFIADKINKLVK